MLYFIRGKVAAVFPALVVLDAGGLGYAVNTSFNSAGKVKKGDEAVFYTYLHVREDILELYGFFSQEELFCFKQLIGVTGVGPKAALAVLSAVTPEKLGVCVLNEDEKTLCSAQGIGKKTAQRIILEMKDKLGTVSSGASSQDIPVGTALDDAVAALAALGYPRATALAALSGENTAGRTTEELVRAALKKLF